MEDTFSKFVQRFAPADTQPSPEEAEQPGAFDTFLSKMGGAGPMETLTFYNGRVELRYDKVNHLYFRVNPEQGNLIPVEGVTTVAHIIDRSVALIPWASKKVVEKLLTLVPTYVNLGGTLSVKDMTFEDFTKIALDAKTAPKDELEDAGDVGHKAHKWLELYITALIKKDTSEQRHLLTSMCDDDRATNCVKAGLDWMSAHNVRWLVTERKVYSEKYGYAGTTDGRGLVDSCSNPLCCAKSFKDVLSIIDWKSSNALYVEFLFQLAAYQQAEREELGLDIRDRWILRLGKEDGHFESWHMPFEDFQEDLDTFLACLALYRLVHSVEERMHIKKVTLRAAKKEAKATAKAIKIAEEKAAKAITKAEKKLAREQEKAAIKAAAETARAAKKKVREEEKVALKAATQDKKKKKVANESKVLLERTAELSPKVAALLEDAHTVATPVTLTSIKDALDTAMQSIETQVVSEGNWENRGLDIIYPGPLTTPVLKGTDEELQMQCMQPVPLPETTEEESFTMFKLPEEKL